MIYCSTGGGAVKRLFQLKKIIPFKIEVARYALYIV